MRVISLLASGTEIACALGAGDELVGRSHECDNPEWVKALPPCTRAAFDVAGSSREIDHEVRRRLRANEPLYHVDTDLINQLKPDLLITQTHCEVCAVTPGDLVRAKGSVVVDQVVALSAGSIAGIFDGIRSVAHALGRRQAGDALILDMERQIARITARVRDRKPPEVALLEWTDPIFAAGNWGPELVEAAGGKPLWRDTGSHSTTTPWEQIVAAAPDYLIVAPCGFDLERTVKDVPTLEKLPGWFNLGAVRQGQVVLADGNKYFNRSGTTIVDSVRILAEILHPDCFEPTTRGTAWLPYQTESRRTPARSRV